MAQAPIIRWNPVPPTADIRYVWNGKLLVWEKPETTSTYVLGVDTGQGRGQDRSVVQVLRVGDRKRADAQVAEFATDALGPKQFAEVVAAIGRFYRGQETEALAVVERNTAGGGDLTLEDLRFRFGYQHLYSQKNLDSLTHVWTSTLGWFTGGTSRPKLILSFREAVHEDYLQLNSPLLLEEMETFEGDGVIARAKAASGEHDDRVLAMALAYWGAHEAEWLAGEDVTRVRARLLTVSAYDTEHNPNGPKRDFQNTDATLDDYNEYGNSLGRWP